MDRILIGHFQRHRHAAMRLAEPLGELVGGHGQVSLARSGLGIAELGLEIRGARGDPVYEGFVTVALIVGP